MTKWSKVVPCWFSERGKGFLVDRYTRRPLDSGPRGRPYSDNVATINAVQGDQRADVEGTAKDKAIEANDDQAFFDASDVAILVAPELDYAPGKDVMEGPTKFCKIDWFGLARFAEIVKVVIRRVRNFFVGKH